MISVQPHFAETTEMSSALSWEATDGTWTWQEERLLDQRLFKAVATVLELDEVGPAPQVHVTFSGSIALDRALQAFVDYSRAHGAVELEIITTSPSIDIIPAMVAEHPTITNQIVAHAGHDLRIDVDEVIRLAEQELAPSVSGAVLVCSPENPTGDYWNERDLRRLAQACEATSRLLIVDHSFLLAGVHRGRLPRIWEVVSSTQEFIGTWDTGKTFGLGGEKLGFLVASSGIDENLRGALSTLQFDVARRDKQLFAALLGAPEVSTYLEELRDVCRANLKTLQSELGGVATVLRCPAGSLALLSLGADMDEATIAARLLGSGVGVIAASTFFHVSSSRHGLLRVALARDPDVFFEAVGVMRSVLVSP